MADAALASISVAALATALSAAIAPLMNVIESHAAAREERAIARDESQRTLITHLGESQRTLIAHLDGHAAAQSARDAARDARDAARDAARDESQRTLITHLDKNQRTLIAHLDKNQRTLITHLDENQRTLTAHLDGHSAAQIARDAARDARALARNAVLDAVLARALRGNQSGSPLSITRAAAVGDRVLELLRAQGLVSVFVPAATDVIAAAPPTVCAALLGATDVDEGTLIRLLTPTLRELRDCKAGDADALAADPCAPVLVNSEHLRWLDAGSSGAPLPSTQLKKPDLFLTHAPFWRGTLVAGAAVGILASRALQADGCAREFFEAKRGGGALTSTDFGQLVDYHSRVPGVCRSALFNAHVVWLYESRHTTHTRLVQTTWDALGSRALFRDFFNAPRTEPTLITVARHVTRMLGVVPAVEGASFLGAGGLGRVFRVRKTHGGAQTDFALKLSCVASADELAGEFALLKAAAFAGAPVARVVADSLCVVLGINGVRSGGGYLLADVLVPVKSVTPARCRDAFRALAAVHACGLVHGDARVQNLLLSPLGRGAFVWIDFRGAADAPLTAAQAADVRQLAASVLGLDEGVAAAPDGGAVFALDATFAGVAAALAAAMPRGGVGAYDALAEAIAAELERRAVG